MTPLLQSGILRIAVAIVATALVGGVAAMLVERGENAGLRFDFGCGLVGIRYPHDGRVW